MSWTRGPIRISFCAVVFVSGPLLVGCSRPSASVSAGPVQDRVDAPLKQYSNALKSETKSLELRPSQQTAIPLFIQNTSRETWASNGKFPITVSYVWMKDEQRLSIEGARTALPRPVRPGETISVTAQVLAPPESGAYMLRISLVQEGVTWFYSSGASTLDLPSSIQGRPVEPDSVTAFHLWFYQQGKKTWDNTFWLGIPIQKNPFDLQIYQEIIYETKPDLIIETGSLRGGSALFFASLFDVLKRGRVISIDIIPEPTRPKHDRITYLTGSSTAGEIIRSVRSAIKPNERVMVTLDSLHTRDHVIQELRLYSPFVTPGNYLVVEDSNVNGNPIYPGTGPGPMEALSEFLAENNHFISDREREKYGFTFNPRGWLKRIK